MSKTVPKQTIQLFGILSQSSDFEFEAHARLSRSCRALQNETREGDYIVPLKTYWILRNYLLKICSQISTLLNLLIYKHNKIDNIYKREI